MASSDSRAAAHSGRSIPGTAGRRFFRLLFAALFFGTVFAGAGSVTAAEAGHAEGVNCDVHHGSCTGGLPGRRVVLDINPKPVKAMTDLTFRVTLEGKETLTTPYIDLGMPGMKMGPNRVSLKPVGEGIYEGTGIIVRCPSGKRIWKATVTLPEAGTVEFVFDVIY